MNGEEIKINLKYELIERMKNIDGINNILACNNDLRLEVIDYDCDSNYEKGSIFEGLQK